MLVIIDISTRTPSIRIVGSYLAFITFGPHHSWWQVIGLVMVLASRHYFIAKR